MFESLSDKLSAVFDRLTKRGSLTEADVNEALKEQTWDDSVKSLVAFPEVLSLMDGKLDWTQKLGDAFLAQEKGVLDAVQRLRARAQRAVV
mgnify:CR=1 FL=1